MFVHVLVQASSTPPQVRTGALSGTSWVGRKASWLKFTLHEQDAGKRKRTPLYTQISRYGYGWIDAPEPSLAPMDGCSWTWSRVSRPPVCWWVDGTARNSELAVSWQFPQRAKLDPPELCVWIL